MTRTSKLQKTILKAGKDKIDEGKISKFFSEFEPAFACFERKLLKNDKYDNIINLLEKLEDLVNSSNCLKKPIGTKWLKNGFILAKLAKNEEAKAAYKELLISSNKKAENPALFASAYSAFNKVLSTNSKDPETWSKIGESLQKLQEFRGALRAFREPRGAYRKTDYFRWFKTGECYQNIRYHKKAVKEFKKASNFEPLRAASLFKIGVNHAIMGDHEKAIKHFENVVKTKDQNLLNNPQPWLFLAESCRLLKRNREAVEAYEKGISICREDPDAWHHKGACLFELGEYKESLTAFKEAAKISPDSRNVWTIIGINELILENYKEAIENFEKTIGYDPKNALALFKKGECHLFLSEYSQAVNCFEKAIMINPKEEYWMKLEYCLGKLEKRGDSVNSNVGINTGIRLQTLGEQEKANESA